MQRPASHPDSDRDTWWHSGAEALLAELGASPGGLSAREAEARLALHGGNRLAHRPRSHWLTELAQRLRNPLVAVLLVAGGLSLLTGEAGSAAIIAGVVLLSLVLDEFQNRRAENAAQQLARSVAVRARVLRDGAEREIDVAQLVPGDVVLLHAGALVPADGVLLAAQDLFVRQSALTGESFPVEKHAGRARDVPMEEAESALFLGSSVVSGTGTLLVCRTGGETQMGGMSHLLAAPREDLAFENDLRAFGNFILRITLFLVLFVMLVTGLAHRAWLESFLFAVALAVGLTPELLPMVVTISLSRGALRLAREDVIVKRLSAIHNLGSMDVLCTDKTGTLTEARIELVRHVDVAGDDSAATLEGAYLNSRFESGVRTPLEEATLARGGVDASGWTKIDEIPFDFERRRLSVLLERAGERRLIVKGAPGDVLAHCSRCLVGAEVRELSPAMLQLARKTLESLEQQGLRVLAVAERPVPASQSAATLDDENELVLAGYAAFLDPPKADAAAALADLHRKGVPVKVITGDSDLVTRHVCDALGLRVQGVLLGADIERMDDRALAHAANKANLFCRVNPMQKDRVIRALRSRGHVVGYLGDGVNDAPALHSADVGISVDTAADSARAAADLILLRHSLAVLSDAITEGRRTFANTRKYILLGTSSNFGNMASMAAAAVFLPFLPMLPVQILLNNLLYDSVSAALPLDRVESAEVARPQRWDMRQLRRFMFIIGPVSSLFDIATFVVLLHVLGASASQFQSGWFIESIATQVLAVFLIRTRASALAGRPHRALAGVAALALLTALALPFTAVGAWFSLVPLPASWYAALAGMTAAYLVTLEAAKRLFWRHAARGHRLLRSHVSH